MTDVANNEFAQLPLRRFIRDIVDGPFGSSLTSSHYSDEGARVIRLGNIGAAHFKDGDAAYIPLEYFKHLRQHEVSPGDLIIAGLGDTNHPVGRACVAPAHLGLAIVKADCFRARLDEDRLSHRYAAWALSSSFVSSQVQTLTRGSTRARINLDVAREIQVPTPSLLEQRRIADFLDAETARIDRLAEWRARQVELLRTSEKSVISELIESNSGTPTRVKYLSNQITSGPRGWGDLAVDSGSLFLRITNIPRHGIELDLRDSLYVSAPEGPERERSRTQLNDVLVSITADIGSVALVDERAIDGNISQHVALIRPVARYAHAAWLAYAIKCARSNQRLRMSSYGGTKVGLGLGDVANLVINVPEYCTQQEIADRISQELANRNRLLSAMKNQRKLLLERRQALITAAVTGQFDVSTASGRGVESP
ncbi:restriction endonuclease subunit S [Streptomyces sp. SD15]